MMLFLTTKLPRPVTSFLRHPTTRPQLTFQRGFLQLGRQPHGIQKSSTTPLHQSHQLTTLSRRHIIKDTTASTTSTSLFLARRSASTRDNSTPVPVEISPSNHGTQPLTSLLDNHNKSIQRYLQNNRLTKPTPIQAHTIPLLHQGHDVMVSSQTGSGKTLMFALPLCQSLMANRNNNKPAAIILNPTRELALQTHQVIQALTGGTLKTGVAVGGLQSMSRQELRQCDILVATPGRLLQHIDERTLSLRQAVQFIVIDEADRMLDLGFEPQLRRIARALGRQQQTDEAANSSSRQTVLCSATFPPAVQRLASDFLRPDYYFVAAGKVGGMHNRIQQRLLWFNNNNYYNRNNNNNKSNTREAIVIKEVNSFLKQQQNSKKKSSVIVFCNTKDLAEDIGKQFGKKQCRVVTGDKTQNARNQSLQLFRQGKVPILVATDVAARGLHVDHVGLVVQADAPRDVDTFVHRIGRTGRAGATGQALAVLDGRSMGIAADLVDLLRDAQQSVPPWLMGMAHVARAKRMDEEEAIAAGGGFATTASSSVNQEEENGDDSDHEDDAGSFSSQDFRKDAEAGTWGMGRDTSYHEFDDEAYGSFDDISLEKVDDMEEEEADDDDRLSDQNQESHQREMATSAGVHDPLESFQKQLPSKQLRNWLKKETGDDNLSDQPDRKVYQTLSKGRDQKLKFEYLGMFPFSEVSPLLSQGYNDRDSSDKASQLPTVLMVAEKPSIAKAVADALSESRAPRQRKGISRALPIYEFTTKKFLPEQNELCRVKVTSVIGHVFSLAFDENNGGEERDGFTDPSEFYNLPVVKKEETSSSKLRVVDHLRALAADSDHLVLWLDCDPEGENIAHEVIGVTRKAFEARVARDLRENESAEAIRRIHRARFSAITKDALQQAFSTLEEPDAALSRSVDARQELDLRVGVSMTRLLNWRCIGLARKHFSPATKLVSYGPCQTPALSFCVERAREIESFQSQPYHKVEVTCFLSGKEKELHTPKWILPEDGSTMSSQAESSGTGDDNATFDEALADNTAKVVLDAGKLRVSSVEEIHETRKAPLGLNTVALLTSASKAMGMSPKQVMTVAEKLYSSGFISYPRTETTRYDPTGFDVRSALREHLKHPEWGKTASFLLRTRYSSSGRPPLRGHDAGDHPPITPLKAATRDEVGGGNHWRVYDFITRNFLGSLGDDLQYTRRVAELGVAGSGDLHDPRFKLEQVHVDSLGFAGACRWVLNDIGASPKADDGTAIVFHKGLEFRVKSAQSVRGQTDPPRFLQEHELVQLMDKNRIGTDASMATHINNIVERGYVVLVDETGVPLRPYRPPRPGQQRPPRQIGRYMVPSSLGISVIELFENRDTEKASTVLANGDTSLDLLARPEIRAQMESEVKQIATGNMTKEECLEKNLAWFEARYHDLFGSLSKQRVGEFGRSLRPTKDSLRHWKSLRAFAVGSSPASRTSTRRNHDKRRRVSSQKQKKPQTRRRIAQRASR